MRFSERLTPSPWTFAACGLLIPAGLLVFLPVSVPVAIGAAVLFFAGAVAALVLLSPVIEVGAGELRAGRARVPIAVIGGTAGFRGEEATAERGVRLDARAFLCIRGWVDPVVRIELADPADPTPYWIVSTRRPDELIAAIEADR
ncbi:MAG: DUF3093 domain-containing protein [Naasia sp.]